MKPSASYLGRADLLRSLAALGGISHATTESAPDSDVSLAEYVRIHQREHALAASLGFAWQSQRTHSAQEFFVGWRDGMVQKQSVELPSQDGALLDFPQRQVLDGRRQTENVRGRKMHALQAERDEIHAKGETFFPAAQGGGGFQFEQSITGMAVALQAPLFGILEVKTISDNEILNSEPEVAQPATLLAPDLMPRSAVPLPFQPLSPAPRMVACMHEALAQTAPGRIIDIRRAVVQLAAAQLIARWTRRAWRQAPQQVMVLRDRSPHLCPYWQDQDQIVSLLDNWLGKDMVAVFNFSGDPWRLTGVRGAGKGVGTSDWRALPIPPADCTVLLLTDMGALYQRPSDSVGIIDMRDAPSITRNSPSLRWQHVLRHLRRGGANLFMTSLVGTFVQIDLASAQVGPVLRHVARSAALELLLSMLACARRIEPGLLRAIRCLLPELAAQPELEALCWSRHDLFESGDEICVWRPEQVLPYRQVFEQLHEPLQQAIMYCMARQHALRGRATEVQEWLVWSSHVAPKTAARFEESVRQASSWLKAFVANQRQKPLNPNWLTFALQTCAAQGGDNNLYRHHCEAIGPLWGLAHQESLRRGQTPPSAGSLPPGRLQAWSQPPTDVAPRMYHLLQERGQWILQAMPPTLFETGLDNNNEKVSLSYKKGNYHAASHLRLLLAGNAAIGMPLRVSSLAVTRLEDANNSFLTQEFTWPQFDELPIGPALPNYIYEIYTGEQVLRLGTIVSPLPQLYATSEVQHSAGIGQEPTGLQVLLQEQGQDQFGVYIDLLVSKQGVALYGSSTALVSKDVLQRLRFIHPGRFLMGSPITEISRQSIEGPQNRVIISQGFWLADTACTQALWLAIMGKNPAYFNEHDGGCGEYPVEQVSWYDVQEFLRKLNRCLPDGCVATLPTEAEWEYACRAGTGTAFAFGSTISTDLVNYDGRLPYDLSKDGIYRTKTEPVGALGANAWGCYQMHGNVWEWCFDEFVDYTDALQIDPALAAVWAWERGDHWGGKAARVLRGGSWFSDAQSARSAFRSNDVPSRRHRDTGFRFALRHSNSKRG